MLYITDKTKSSNFLFLCNDWSTNFKLQFQYILIPLTGRATGRCYLSENCTKYDVSVTAPMLSPSLQPAARTVVALELPSKSHKLGPAPLMAGLWGVVVISCRRPLGVSCPWSSPTYVVCALWLFFFFFFLAVRIFWYVAFSVRQAGHPCFSCARDALIQVSVNLPINVQGQFPPSPHKSWGETKFLWTITTKEFSNEEKQIKMILHWNRGSFLFNKYLLWAFLKGVTLTRQKQAIFGEKH